MAPADGQGKFSAEMGAHEAFLASGNRATRQPTQGKVRARRRRNRRVVSTLTARRPKIWHFYGFAHRAAWVTTCQVRVFLPSVPGGQGMNFCLILVAQCSEMPAAGNRCLNRWCHSVCDLRVQCDYWDDHLFRYLRHFRGCGSADHEPENEMRGRHEGPLADPASGPRTWSRP